MAFRSINFSFNELETKFKPFLLLLIAAVCPFCHLSECDCNNVQNPCEGKRHFINEKNHVGKTFSNDKQMTDKSTKVKYLLPSAVCL